MLPDSRFVVWVAVLFLIGAVLIHGIHLRRHSLPDQRKRDWRKYTTYFAIVNGLWASAYWGRPATGILLGAIAVGGAVEILGIVRGPYRVAWALAAGAVFSVALGQPLLAPGEWRGPFAFLVLVTATTDSFAELIGRLLGGPRLWPRISPAKTLAGSCAGLIMAVAVSLALGFVLPGTSSARLALVGLLTGLSAVIGDLLFSALKRAVGVKDFSAALPGHGGILDRFDSLLLAAPVFHWSRVILTR